MSISSNGPTHERAKFRRPHVYSASVADPPRWPRLVVLRSSCGHILGLGLVARRRQSYVAWKTCR